VIIRQNMPVFVALLFVASLLLPACGRPDNRSADQVASSILARSAAVQSLKEAKRVREDGRGSLRAESGVYLEVSERRIVEQENYERDKIFSLLAKSYQVGRANVAQVFAKLANRSK
jgi:uncharacterized protein YdbL (DUF1318 family)